MVNTITKRDGRKVSFDPNKIFVAICKAMATTPLGVDEDLAVSIAKKIQMECDDNIGVETIQDRVEFLLMDTPRKEVAKAYISYRHQRNMARKANTLEVFRSIVEAQANEVTRENANMNADTPAGMMMKFASESTKPFVDECLLSDNVRDAVRNGLIHIHDKDYYPTKSLTCLQHPLDVILENGFHAGHGESRAAKRIETAAILACISMETVQNEMHGGQAIPAFDFYLAPYVKATYNEEVAKIEKLLGGTYADLYTTPIDDYISKDLDGLVGFDRWKQYAINQTVWRVHQAMESFIHNMNTIHSRGGNQVVFSSINYGTDTSAEGRCIIREMLNSTYEGVGNGSTAIFPIQIWKKKRGVNYLEGDPNYDLYKFACKVTAKRFFPNFLNLDASFNKDDAWEADDPKRYMHEVATMGCRTRVFENRFGPKTSVGRGNLSFTTVNLVRIALESKDNFFERLDEVLEIAAKQLHERYKFQQTALKKQFPLLMCGLWTGSESLKPNDSVGELLNQGTLGIGFIGLAECLIALTGKHHGESEESQALGIKIVTYMRDKANEFSGRYQHNYSVLATPAEGLSGRFTRMDRKKFGVITGITDREYYTNSNHIPVYFHCTPKRKAELEAPYHALTLGGHIFYVEMNGDATHNPEAIMAIVDLMDRYDLGYGSVNHNRNRCLDCGYEDAQKNLKECPVCGSTNIDILQRITGYLVGTTERWNSAKKAELRDRVVHK